MIKHHLVQRVPVAVNARFCVRESFSGGRKKSLTPARTMAHFMTGALFHPTSFISSAYTQTLEHFSNSPQQIAGGVWEMNVSWGMGVVPSNQKCTVLTPTSLVHNRCRILCLAPGAPSTVGVPATVCWYRRKICVRCRRRRKGARKVLNWWVQVKSRRRGDGEGMADCGWI